MFAWVAHGRMSVMSVYLVPSILLAVHLVRFHPQSDSAT